MIYVLIFFLLVLLRFTIGRAPQIRSHSYSYFTLLFGLFVFSAFRFEVGCDWGGYLNQFRLQEADSLSGVLKRSDPGWWATMELVHRLGLSYPWINVISSAIFFAGVHVLGRRQKDGLSFLILLFPVLIINLPMSGIRQGAAIGLMCVAFAAFIDRRTIRFILWTFVASLFHSSALIFILLAPLVHGVSVARTILAGILLIPGFFFLLSMPQAEVAFVRYVDTGVEAAGALFRTGILFLTGGLFFFALRKKWAVMSPPDYSLVLLGSGLMLAIISVLPLSTVIADRLGYYLVPIQAIILLKAPTLVPAGWSRVLFVVPYIGLGLLLVVWTSVSMHFASCYEPYQTWLFGFPTGQRIFF